MPAKLHVDHITVRILDKPDQPAHRLEFSSVVLLLDVLLTGAEVSGVRLLPPDEQPLDALHNLRNGHAGPAIENLDETLDKYLESPEATHEFAIELLRVFAVNSRWAIADKPELTPREILALVNLKPEEFTLYPPHSDKFLPLDTPVAVHRGERFEAQRDGKYGG